MVSSAHVDIHLETIQASPARNLTGLTTFFVVELSSWKQLVDIGNL